MNARARTLVTCALLALPLAACGDGGPGAAPAETQALEERDPRFADVFRELGPLRVAEGDAEAESDVRPWSAWWLPVNSTYLFEGEKAPLRKYDAYVKKARGRDGLAAEYEKAKVHDPNSISWEGSCDAWATASLLEPEPVAAVERQGIRFGIGDLKALLVKSYQRVPGKKQYGQRFEGTRGSVYDDIYPEQFHRFVQAQLFERRRPFVMDKDPGIAVWNTPVWRALLQLRRNVADPRVMHGYAALWGADPWVRHYDEVGTRTVIFEYTYDLYGHPRPDGTLDVGFGVWTSLEPRIDAVNYHPDFLTTLPEKAVGRTSGNPELDPSVVDEILGKM
jgi:hypothetical protein